MKKPLYRVYADRQPVGAVCLCNTGGLSVYEPTADDSTDTDFITAWALYGKVYGFHRCKVHYTAAGRAYLIKGRQRFYMDEITRVK